MSSGPRTGPPGRQPSSEQHPDTQANTEARSAKTAETRGDEWEREEGVTCVVCPACAFAFDECHVTAATGEYDCPECGYPEPVTRAVEPKASGATEAGVPADTTKRAEAEMILHALGRLTVPDYKALAALDALVAELDRLRLVNERLGYEVDEARRSLDRRHAEVASLQARITSRHDDVRRSCERAEQAYRERDEARAELDRLWKTTESTRYLLAEEECDLLVAELDRLRDERDELHERWLGMRGCYDREVIANGVARAELDRLRDERAEALAAVGMTGDESLAELVSYVEGRAALAADARRYDERKLAETDRRALALTLNDVGDDVDRLRAELERVTRERHEQTERANKLGSAWSGAQDELVAVRERAERMRDALTNARKLLPCEEVSTGGSTCLDYETDADLMCAACAAFASARAVLEEGQQR